MAGEAYNYIGIYSVYIYKGGRLLHLSINQVDLSINGEPMGNLTRTSLAHPPGPPPPGHAASIGAPMKRQSRSWQRASLPYLFSCPLTSLVGASINVIPGNLSRTSTSSTPTPLLASSTMWVKRLYEGVRKEWIP